MLSVIKKLLKKEVKDRDFTNWRGFFENLDSYELDGNINLLSKFNEKDNKEIKKIISEFKKLLGKKDTYFLENPKSLSFEDDDYENSYSGGFMEKCFQSLLNIEMKITEEITDVVSDEKQDTENYIYRANSIKKQIMNHRHYVYLQMIALCVAKGLSFELLKEKFNEKFDKIIEFAILYSETTINDFEDEKMISNAVKKKMIQKNQFIEVAFMRGTILTSRDE